MDFHFFIAKINIFEIRTCGMHVFDAKKSSFPDTRQN